MSLKVELEQVDINLEGDGEENVINLSLMQRIRLLGLHIESYSKGELVGLLVDYLMDPSNIEEIWNSLTPFEQDFVKDVMVNGYYMISKSLEVLATRHQVTKRNEIDWYKRDCRYITNYFSEDSRVGLFFVMGGIPEEIAQVLRGLMGPTIFNLVPGMATDEEVKAFSVFKQRKYLSEDLTNFVGGAIEPKVKLTTQSGYPTKGSMQYLDQLMHYREYKTEEKNWETIHKSEDLHKLRGTYELFLEAQVLEKQGDRLVLGKEGDKFLAASVNEQVKILIEAYKESTNIDEVKHIKGEKIKGEKIKAREPEGLFIPRREILNMLGRIGDCAWIRMEDFAKELCMCNRNFLFPIIQGIEFRNNCYGSDAIIEGDWDRIERPYLDVILLDYLAPLGLVDVAIKDVEIQHEIKGKTVKRLEVVYFKVTKLGARILDNYKYFFRVNVIDETKMYDM